MQIRTARDARDRRARRRRALALQAAAPRATDGRQYRWLRELLDILEHASGPEEFLEHTKLEMFQDQVFCFTPKGDLIALPRGATPVDFAYAVHSADRRHLRRRQDQRPHVPLRTRLQNGDQVEIITSKAQTPSPTWERFVVTGKARARIRRFVRIAAARAVSRARPLDPAERAFQQEGYEFSEKALEGVLKNFKQAERRRPLRRRSARATSPAARSSTRSFPAAARGAAPRQGRAARPRAARQGGRSGGRGPDPRPDSRAWRCISPAAAIRCRATASSASSPPARASPSTPSTARRWTSFADTPERWLDVAWDVGDDEAEERHVGRMQRDDRQRARQPRRLTTMIGRNERQHHQPEDHQPRDRVLRDPGRHRGRDVRHLTNIIAALRATPASTPSTGRAGEGCLSREVVHVAACSREALCAGEARTRRSADAMSGFDARRTS